MMHAPLPPHGPSLLPSGGARFIVWAPRATRVDLRLADGRSLAMARGGASGDGYHTLDLADARPGLRYGFSLDGGPTLPDPASRFQPDGPHGLSEVVDPAHPWTDGEWKGLPRPGLVIYELHVGTYTPAGTFEGVIPHLDHLADLGITAVELMPIAQFPGRGGEAGRNWGYDGVGLFAAQNTYGGPVGLRALVDAAHARGLAVILDVVYNHLGPEGNYLDRFGPYFTDRYRTPWGKALNFDGEHSDHVRRFFIENALYWITDCHLDGLRLDAVHAIADASPIPFVQELAGAVHARARELGRLVHVIAESAANDARLLRPTALVGCGLDAQWNDDFHHSLRTLLTGESAGYYSSYGRLEHLARAYRDGFVYTGQHSAFHKRRHGSPTAGIPSDRFVVFSQNHDHVGNRMLGERPTVLMSREKLKLAAAATILSPFVPLLFMGEEYAEVAPFLYFISHTDPALVEAVRRGRAEEFASFHARGEAPDPQAEETFARSKLDHTLRRAPGHRELLAYYKALLRLRRETPALALLDRRLQTIESDEEARTLVIHRRTPRRTRPPAPGDEALLFFNFSDAAAVLPFRTGQWSLALDSSAEEFGGPGAGGGSIAPRMKPGSLPALTLPPHSFALYTREPD